MTMIDIHSFIDIPGYPQYQIKISTNEIWSHKVNRVLKIAIQRSGHLTLSMYNDLKKTIGIHRIVMWIKEGPCPEGLEVCHKDGDPTNNHPDNLRYDTKSSNTKDKVRHGTHALAGKCGANSYFAKKINQYSVSGEFIKEWGAGCECSAGLKIHAGDITQCCRGKRKTAGGFVFKYA